jgi:hypothetical protein
MAKKRSGAGIERERERHLRDLPPDIPFQCLGLDAQNFHLIDGDGLYRAIPRDRAGHMTMLGICGGENQEWAWFHYSRWRKAGKDLERVPRSLQPEHLGQDVGLLCALKGKFDPTAMLRMQGAWTGEDGDLILHCGDHLWIRGARCPTGLRGGYAYPREQPIPPPHAEPVGMAPGHEVLENLSRWRYGRQIDPVLLLGLLGLAMVAGAMRHRPNVLLIGEHGSGKTGLLERFKDFLGLRMLLTPDATPAGITQRVGHSNLLIGLDEKEGSDDPRRDSGLLALLRACYSGGESLRGGQDHTGVSFTLRSVVLAAAINPPLMDSADRSRNVLISVLGPPEDRALRVVFDARLALLGTQLLRRLADSWKRLQLDVLPAWDTMLRDFGFDGRGADTVATLLAIAWVLREDRALTQWDVDAIAADLTELRDEARAERQPSYQRFLDHLLGLASDPLRKGEWRTVLETVQTGGGYGTTPEELKKLPSDAARHARNDPAAIDAQRQLSRIGLRIGADRETGDAVLWIANQSTVLSDMLRGTAWAGMAGRGSPWARLLLRAPGAKQVGPMRFASGMSRAVQLPLDYVLRGTVGPAPEDAVEGWEQAVRDLHNA